MTILLHSWSLGPELLRGRIKSEELVQLAATLGFDGIEWLDRLLPSYDRAELEKLATAQADAGLKSTALSLSLELAAGSARIAEQVDRSKSLLALCPVLGVSRVRVSVGGAGRLSLSRLLLGLEQLRTAKKRRQTPLGFISKTAYRLALPRLRPPRKHSISPKTSDSALQSMAWALQPLARQAGDLGLLMGLENHFGPTAGLQEIEALLDLTGHNLGFCLDTGNFADQSQAETMVEALAKKTVHVHYKVETDDPIAEAGAKGYDGILSKLSAHKYQGWYSIEYQGSGDGAAVCAKTLDFLNKMLRSD